MYVDACTPPSIAAREIENTLPDSEPTTTPFQGLSPSYLSRAKEVFPWIV